MVPLCLVPPLAPGQGRWEHGGQQWGTSPSSPGGSPRSPSLPREPGPLASPEMGVWTASRVAVGAEWAQAQRHSWGSLLGLGRALGAGLVPS